MATIYKSDKKLIEKTTIQIPKNRKSKNILKSALLFSVITLSSFAVFYQTSIKDNVNSADLTIQKNKEYIQSFGPEKNNRALFIEKYTDEDFAKDLKLFSLLYNSSLYENKNSPSYDVERKRAIFMKMRRVMMISDITGYSYEKVYDLEVKPLENLETLNKKEKAEALLKFNENTKNISKITHNKDFSMVYADTGYFTYLYNESYKNLSYSFNKEYKKDSYIDSFILDLSANGDENIKSKKQIQNNILDAYKNKDYDTLRLFFKQNREFVNYFNGLSIGDNPISLNNFKKWNSEQTYAYYYMAWRNFTNGFIHFKSSNEAANDFINDYTLF